MRIPSSLCAIGLCALALPAQTKSFVSPSIMAGAEGYSATYYPFFRPSSSATGRIYHEMSIHDLGSTAIGRIRSLAFRRDSNINAGTTNKPLTTDVEITLSSAARTSRTMITTFASNHGTDKKIVVARKKINFKAVPHLPVAPQTFFFQVPLDATSTFVFKGGSLATEYKVHGNTSYNSTTRSYYYLYLDYAYNSTSSSNQSAGRACYGSNTSAFLPFYGYAYSYHYRTAPARLRYYAYSYNGIPGGLGVNLIAAAKLPASIQLPGQCYLHINPGLLLGTIPGRSYNNSSTYYYPPRTTTTRYLELPWIPAMANQRIYTQSIGIDPTANATGLTFTNYTRMQLPNYKPNGLGFARVYYYNLTRATGYLSRDSGVVTQINM